MGSTGNDSTKVNIGVLRQIQAVAHDALAIWGEALRLLMAPGLFCDECGDTKPESGFYPLIAHGPNSISGLICNDCDRKTRGITS